MSDIENDDTDNIDVGQPLDADKSAASEDTLQVEVVDDTPPEDRNRPRRAGEPDLGNEDEASQYSEKVKKRISKLKYEFHEERRRAEELERQQAALADFAKRVRDENLHLKKALQSGRTIIADQMQNRVESEFENAKRMLKDAVELGDIDKQVEAQKKIATLTVEADKVRSFRPVDIEEPEAEPEPRYVPQTPPPKPDQRTVEWAKKNTWFGRDREMTDFARHIHDRLVVFDRVSPNTEDYWQKLDGEIRKRYPHMAEDAEEEDSKPQPKQSVVVAPVKRNSTPPRKVQLSASEVAIAKRLGLTIEQYAAEKLRSMNG
jgi:hypothetical protein